MTINLARKSIIGVVLLALAGYVFFVYTPQKVPSPTAIDPTPQKLTLSGTYGCLPHKNTSGPQTEECAFGVQTDGGAWYAVNFGQSATAMQQFQAGARIIARGFSVPKEALSTDHWMQYDMVGIFTITDTPVSVPVPAR